MVLLLGPIRAAGVWTGLAGTNWSAIANWDDSILPTSLIDVTIPAGRVNYPTTNSSPGAECRALTIEPGARLRIPSGKSLRVYGRLISEGSFENFGSASLQDSVVSAGTFVSTGNLELDGYVRSRDSLHNFGRWFSQALLVDSGVFRNAGTLAVEVAWVESPARGYNHPGSFLRTDDLRNRGRFFNEGQHLLYDDLDNRNFYLNLGSAVSWEYILNDSGAVFLSDSGSYVEAEEMQNEGSFVCRGNVAAFWSDVWNSGDFSCQCLLIVDALQNARGGTMTLAGSTDVWLCVDNSGNLTNEGHLVCREDVSNDSLFTNNGSVIVFFNVYNSCRLTNSGSIRVEGSLESEGRLLSGPGSEVRFVGGWEQSSLLTTGTCVLHDLVVEKDSTLGLELEGDLTLKGTLEVKSGALLMTDNVLILGDSTSPASVSLSGGRTHFLGSMDEPVVLTAADSRIPYRFCVTSGARMEACFTEFGYVGSGGVRFESGSMLDTAGLSYCRFTHGNCRGPMLKLENDQHVTLDEVRFDGSAGYNIEKLGSLGSVFVMGGGGDRWGEQFDNDPGGRVRWAFPTEPGWTEVCSMPSAPSGKPAKRGAWATLHAPTEKIYATKGYKTTDFYSYDPYTDLWESLTGMPFQTHPLWGGKVPRKGSKGVSDGNDIIYVTQGNNSLGFWAYSVSKDSWWVLPDIPLGGRRKKVKGGTDMAFVPAATDSDIPYVYLLKGYKSEFYRFNTTAAAWDTLPDAPEGERDKWGNGSWLCAVSDDGDAKLYACKARYNELWEYDIDAGDWDERTSMPFVHPMVGRKKKLWAGGSACSFALGGNTSDEMLALKGGNTQELWWYRPEDDSWTPLETIPSFGSTQRKKRIKYGADIVHYAGPVFYVQKGNKTRELWRYVLPIANVQAKKPPARSLHAQNGEETAVTVLPSVLVGNLSLPPLLTDAVVLDALGRKVMDLRPGENDVRHVAPGVYFVREEGPRGQGSEGSSVRKIVIQR